MIKPGDEVKLKGNERVHTVSSVTETDVMLCMYIAGRYQLRGPFPIDAIEDGK